MGKTGLIYYLIVLASGIVPFASFSQTSPVSEERKYYSVENVDIPNEVVLEVGGMAFTSDGKLGISTRRGEIWIIDNPYQPNSKYKRFAYGLHETLGLAWHEGSFYTTQRSELTKVTDTNNDGEADLYQTVAAWPLSGNYHEYSYGPLFMPDGKMLVTLNLSWVGRGESLTKWRGWMMKITPEGKLIPFAAGMRSPAGFGFNNEGEIFYGENQGDWIGSGRITHLDSGDFAGHPASLKWADLPESPIPNLRREQFPDSIGSLHEFSKGKPHFKEPAIIFPHTLMGISTSAILAVKSDSFGPFKDQLLVADQGHSKVMRAYLEKVNGKYQGACFPFLEGFSSGILRMEWGQDNTLFVGMTSRGWASTGKDLYGLQRVKWKNDVPFEIKTMKAKSNGFELEFTKPVNKKEAVDVDHYHVTGFTYSYHKKYGSPIIDQQDCEVVKAAVSADGLVVRLYIRGLREGYVHQLDVKSVKSKSGEHLLHNVGYYTLNNIPGGSEHDHHIMMKASSDVVSVKKSSTSKEGCGPDLSKNVTAQPSEWTKADFEIRIGTKPGLKFDIENFEVKEGARVKLVFSNNDDMLHNLVITKPGKGNDVGQKALAMGLDGSRLGYVPNSNDVLFNTCILQPDGSQTIYFNAPKAGEYPFICSFPGHYAVMKGVMKVVKTGEEL
jgi:uncharacterized cupredoxin-like copper-binding protein/glucose/arabinose dehydrogenase